LAIRASQGELDCAVRQLVFALSPHVI